MPSHKRVAMPDDPSRALAKGLAMDVGKEVFAYVEWMYPQAVSATSSTFRLALRNVIHNQIMATLDMVLAAKSEDEILAWLRQRKADRRASKRKTDILRDTDWEAFRAKRDGTGPSAPMDEDDDGDS